jgi:TATA-box binding protein (TBP) (component of TFIID and TFIIIB)
MIFKGLFKYNIQVTMASTSSQTTPPLVKPTPYRISTITFNGDLNAYIRGNIFFQHVSVLPTGSPNTGFVWVECWMNGVQHVRGEYPKKKKSTKRASKKQDADNAPSTSTRSKSFDNQTSMYFQFQKDYMPHVKLFKNGNIHITGLRIIEDGTRILELLSEEVKRIFTNYDTKVLVEEDISKLSVSNPVVRLINSDFQLPFKIRRKELHQLLIAQPYNNICSFQPGTYPGVKLEYYWNKTHPQQDGCCRCEKPCFGKGTGKSKGDCKKVTVAVFDSGSVLITGATSHQQVDNAYQYICKVILDNVAYLKKNIPAL